MRKDRRAKIRRKTRETDILLELDVDGRGEAKVDTGIAFLDHMLELFAKHGLFDLKIEARGDLKVDIHHTNEDIGICLGMAFNQALGRRRGIRRFGQRTVPMDEVLVRVVADVSGRTFINSVWSDKPLTVKDVRGYNIEYARQFWQSFVNNFPITMNISILACGPDMHHLLEAIFKAAGRALDEALGIDRRIRGVSSTKGRL